MTLRTLPENVCDLLAPRRNHYFYGKLLDTYHLRLETDYHNTKRWMSNRLITGFGVVCGLDVTVSPDEPDSLVVSPGFAIDRHGHEILVPEESPAVPIPEDLLEARREDEWDREDGHSHVHIVLCAHDCLAEPTPVHAGICGESEPCQPGVIVERYKLDIRPGTAPTSGGELLIPDVICGGKLEYETLVRYVSQGCQPCPEDPCIPLADVRLGVDPDKHKLYPHDVDITIRPLVYTNDLLFQLLLSLLIETPQYGRTK